jgi:ankyrin repeat protein
MNKDGETPIHFASANGFLEVVKYLLDKGVSIDIPDKYGYTPFRRSLFNGEWNTTQYLLDHDALVDSMDTGNSKNL